MKVIGMRTMEISGRRTSPLARRLGLDRNPLRRGSDRAEAWIRIALVLAFLIGAPLAAWGAKWAESVAPTAAHLQRPASIASRPPCCGAFPGWRF